MGQQSRQRGSSYTLMLANAPVSLKAGQQSITTGNERDSVLLKRNGGTGIQGDVQQRASVDKQHTGIAHGR